MTTDALDNAHQVEGENMYTLAEVITRAQHDEKRLATCIEELDPAVESILNKINDWSDEPKQNLGDIIKKGIGTITESFKKRDWGTALESVTSLFASVFASSSGKPENREPERNDWSDRLSLFSEHDVGVVLNTIQTGELSIEKKLAYARLVASRRDAEHEIVATNEPDMTTEILDYQVEQGRIREGDIITFSGSMSGGFGMFTDAVLKTVVESSQNHAAVITNTHPLEITHATKEGVHTMPLITYIQKHDQVSYTIIAGGGTIGSEYAQKQEGKEYDAKNGLFKVFGDDNKLTCSELGMRSYAAANDIDLDTLEKEGKVFPEDIINLSYPKYVADYPRTR